MARSYHRDSKGRFASGGGGQLSKTKARANRVGVYSQAKREATGVLKALGPLKKAGVDVAAGERIQKARIRHANRGIAYSRGGGSGVVRKGTGYRAGRGWPR